MKNKTKKILAGACLGLVGMGCLTGCNKDNNLQSTYNLTVINDSQYGIISPVLDNETNSVTVDRGDDYTFTITPREGYEIDNLLIDGKLVEPQGIYTFENIEKDHSIGAVYSLIDIDITGVNMLSVRLTFNHDSDYLKVSDFENMQNPTRYDVYYNPKNTTIKLKGKIIQLLPNDTFEYNYLYEEKEIAEVSFDSPDGFFDVDYISGKGNPVCANLILGELKNKVHFLGDKQEARFKIVINIDFTTGYGVQECSGTYSKTFNIVASLDQTSDNKVTLIEEDGYEDIFVKSVDNGKTFLQKIELVFED